MKKIPITVLILFCSIHTHACWQSECEITELSPIINNHKLSVELRRTSSGRIQRALSDPPEYRFQQFPDNYTQQSLFTVTSTTQEKVPTSYWHIIIVCMCCFWSSSSTTA